MRPLVVVVDAVLAYDLLEVPLVEDHHPVQAFPAAAPDPAIGIGICPPRSPMVRPPPGKTLRCRASCGITTSRRAVSVVKAKPPCSPGVHSRFQIVVPKS